MSKILVGRYSVISIKALPISSSQGARLVINWFLSKPIISSSHPSSLPASFIGFSNRGGGPFGRIPGTQLCLTRLREGTSLTIG